MFRALWIKQWAQLRTLRWVGFGLGIVLPFFLWGGAAAGKRGWLGFNLGSYDLVTLFAEALPAFSVMLWGLLAVMFAAQTFAGDRADGTDRFLLERPVPRRRTWLARGLASLASSLLVVLGNTLYITALVALVQDGSSVQVYTKVVTALWIGTGLAVLGTIGGMAAGEMVRTPLQAVLIGGLLAALPIGVAMFFVSVFELVWIGHVHLAFIVTPIMPLAMILSSYRAGCLGEPSGRGRIQRGAVVLT
ncbi:MAG: ABC transporter permease subunit, partial [Acidobacteria bacterium]|nr:ABC transporter permease subunit [Acidobacteriota bacterium]